MNNPPPYYVLYAKYENGTWGAEYGSYDKEEVLEVLWSSSSKFAHGWYDSHIEQIASRDDVDLHTEIVNRREAREWAYLDPQ